MRVVINDANILIDLIQLDLFGVFFELDSLELKTTDFVFEELYFEQKKILENFIESNQLIVIESQEEDLVHISNLLNITTGLSFEDCSVWHFAKTFNAILLTGDGNLRRQSMADGVEVRGILFIFDLLLIEGLLNFENAILKINQLYQLNDRLPFEAKIKRLDCWSRAEHIK